MSSSIRNSNVNSSSPSKSQHIEHKSKKYKSLAMATKVSKKIPGNETLNLIKGASKKLPNQSKKEVSKTPKQAPDIDKIGETKDQKSNLSSNVISSEKTEKVVERFNSPEGKVTMTKKRPHEGAPGPKKDVVVNIPNFKSGNSATKKVGPLILLALMNP